MKRVKLCVCFCARVRREGFFSENKQLPFLANSILFCLDKNTKRRASFCLKTTVSVVINYFGYWNHDCLKKKKNKPFGFNAFQNGPFPFGAKRYWTQQLSYKNKLDIQIFFLYCEFNTSNTLLMFNTVFFINFSMNFFF